MTTALKTRIGELKGWWSLVQTRPLFEMRLAAELDAAGINYFLPLVKNRRTRQDRGRLRSVTKIQPLFATYLFVCLPRREDRPESLTRSIASPRLIDVVDQKGLSWQLANLERALDVDDTLAATPIIQDGQRVRVIEGPCFGMEGEAVEQDGHCRLQICVSMLGQAVQVSVPLHQLEPV